MLIRWLNALAIVSLALAIMFCMHPCDARAQGKTQKISKKLVERAEDMVREIKNVNKQVEKTAEKYDKIFAKSKAKDRQKAYKGLKKEIKKIKDKSVRKSSDQMHKEADRFFSQWSKELTKITDSELRSLSNATLTENRDRYGQIIDAGMKAGSLYESFLSDLENQGRYLEIDTSDAGMAKLETSRAETSAKADELFKKIDELTGATKGYIASLK